jgi:hypothetical protein
LAVATGCDTARIETGIRLGFVAVIAGLIALLALLHVAPLNAIATTRLSTLVGAGIGVDLIGIVTGLFAFVDDPVTAAGFDATIATVIGIDRVAVVAALIAVFASLQVLTVMPVTTNRDHTGDQAGILIAFITVIAGFIALLPLSDVGSGLAIAAACHRAGVQTGVGVVHIAIIAGLVAVLAVRNIASAYAIAAGRQGAIVMAGIGLFDIAIVALLAFIQARVATTQQVTFRGAFIIIGVIAVIAFFVGGFRRMQVAPVNAIAASRFDTAIQAGIIVIKVAIIAGLKSLVPLRKIPSLHLIAADSCVTGVQAGIKMVAVAVITFLVAFPYRPITATGGITAIGAIIGID